VTDVPTETESTEEAAERFDPSSMHGQIIEAEHLARYAWSCQFASGARVLDAGCGMAYGTRMLADAGAGEVVGVDLDKALLAGHVDTPANITLETADVRDLPHEANSFDLVVCFEVIEHVTEPQRVLDELHRVLRPDGLLVVSTPNRDVYTPGNPYHLRDLTPHELRAQLQERFRTVALCRQQTWISSGILDDSQFAAGDDELLDGVQVRKVIPDRPDQETYTIGLASEGELPVSHGLLSLTSDVELRRWTEFWHEQRVVIESLHGYQAEIGQLRQQLMRNEFQLSRMAALEARVNELNELLGWHERMLNSVGWRLTAPLRRGSALVDRTRGKLLAQLREEIMAARSRSRSQ
jgi:SAM-dependent methyltransferase